VLAEREFGIGKFYLMRMSYPASIARLKTLVEKYPLYSRADEALFLLGQDYEGQIALIRSRPNCTGVNPTTKAAMPPGCVGETTKAAMIAQATRDASAAYSQILTRYPVMEHATDAKKRLAALHQPIPRPTKAAVAQNKAEEESRKESTTMTRLMSVVQKGPDVSEAAKIGEPTLVDPTPVAARDVITTSMRQAMAPSGGNALSVESVKDTPPGANEPAPHSDSPAVPATSNPFAQPAAADPNELKPNAAPVAAAQPNAAPDPNELKPNAPADSAVTPPTQVNEIQQGQASNSASTSSSSSSNSEPASDQDISSSKKNKKKGLKKVFSF